MIARERKYNIKREFNLSIPKNTDTGLWVPISRDSTNANYISIIKPSKVFINANHTVLFWNFIKTGVVNQVKLSVEQEVNSTPYEPDISKSYLEQCINLNDDLIMPNDNIIKLAKDLTINMKEDSQKVQVIINYLVQNLKYEYPPKDRDAISVERTLFSDCGGYHALFVSMLRCLGIPSIMDFGARLPDFSPHVWAWWFNKDKNIWNRVDINDLQTNNEKSDRVSYSLGTNPVIGNFPAKILFLQSHLTWDYNFEVNKNLKTPLAVENTNLVSLL